VIEANPRTLAAVVEQLLDDRDAARKAAAQGPGFVAEVHDGRRSAQVLATFLGTFQGASFDTTAGGVAP